MMLLSHVSFSFQVVHQSDDHVPLMKTLSQVDDLKAVVMKLAAADNLRSQGFLRSEQNLPKPNKRGQTWLCEIPVWCV